MSKLQDNTRLSERTLQKIADQSIKYSKPRGPATRKPSSRTKTFLVYDGVDARIVDAVARLGIKNVWRYVDILSPTEVVVKNNPVR